MAHEVMIRELRRHPEVMPLMIILTDGAGNVSMTDLPPQEEAHRIAGMFSERDILEPVVAEGRDPSRTSVGEVMTGALGCCTPGTSVEQAGGAMKNRRIRHLPVVDGEDRFLGLISIGDLNAHHATQQSMQIHYLNEYIYGRV